MQSEMEMFLQIGGVVVPFFSAFAGLFIWGLRRIDRRFDEAAAGRKRIEVQLGERCDRIEKEFKERCGRIEEHCGRIETQLGERCDRIEREFKEHCDRIEERCDRIEERCDRIEERCDRIDERIDRLSDQILSLSIEFGKAQGAARVAVEAAPG